MNLMGLGHHSNQMHMAFVGMNLLDIGPSKGRGWLFCFLWVIFALLDSDTDCEYGSGSDPLT
jgi:hypothetical protein